MSLFANPREHADNPPNTWEVVKVGRRWALRTKDGGTLDTFPTKHRAEEERVGGFFTDLYDKERRWYAGESVSGWRPYQPSAATTDRPAERLCGCGAHHDVHVD